MPLRTWAAMDQVSDTEVSGQGELFPTVIQRTVERVCQFFMAQLAIHAPRSDKICPACQAGVADSFGDLLQKALTLYEGNLVIIGGDSTCVQESDKVIEVVLVIVSPNVCNPQMTGDSRTFVYWHNVLPGAMRT